MKKFQILTNRVVRESILILILLLLITLVTSIHKCHLHSFDLFHTLFSLSLGFNFGGISEKWSKYYG